MDVTAIACGQGSIIFEIPVHIDERIHFPPFTVEDFPRVSWQEDAVSRELILLYLLVFLLGNRGRLYCRTNEDANGCHPQQDEQHLGKRRHMTSVLALEHQSCQCEQGDANHQKGTHDDGRQQAFWHCDVAYIEGQAYHLQATENAGSGNAEHGSQYGEYDDAKDEQEEAPEAEHYEFGCCREASASHVTILRVVDKLVGAVQPAHHLLVDALGGNGLAIHSKPVLRGDSLGDEHPCQQVDDGKSGE